MKILLSPAKSLDFENAKLTPDSAPPIFIEKSEYLVSKLKKLSAKQIKKLMNVSKKIFKFNFEWFYNWQFPGDENAKPAVFDFTSETYRGLDANSFSEKEIKNCNDKLRILSGLYGLLRPSDLVMPYRLEMGTSFKVTPKITNLYKYWGASITDALNAEMKDEEVLVNLASNEYSKAVDLKNIKGKVVTCSFKEFRNGEYKAIMTFAKRARGTMTRFIIKNNLEEIEDLKAFDMDNYTFNDSMSTENEFVFVR